ncbi:sporulation membrane protein YtaF [Paenibacillus tarimensis]
MLMHLVSLFTLAFAVSLDGFGVGVTYGMRKIRIPVLSVIIIAGCSGVVIYTAMQFGALVAGYLSPAVARMIGAAILIGIGGFALVQFWRNRFSEKDGSAVQHKDEPEAPEQTDAEATGDRAVLNLELKRLGLVIQILRTPQAADVDRSGTISASEALLLGFALSLDAFGAGLGAALLGFSPLLTSVLIAVASGTFLLCGMHIGFLFSASHRMKMLSLLPGLILVVMGIIKLF